MDYIDIIDDLAYYNINLIIFLINSFAFLFFKFNQINLLLLFLNQLVQVYGNFHDTFIKELYSLKITYITSKVKLIDFKLDFRGVSFYAH